VIDCFDLFTGGEPSCNIVLSARFLFLGASGEAGVSSAVESFARGAIDSPSCFERPGFRTDGSPAVVSRFGECVPRVWVCCRAVRDDIAEGAGFSNSHIPVGACDGSTSRRVCLLL
jgi:hypothetical protein